MWVCMGAGFALGIALARPQGVASLGERDFHAVIRVARTVKLKLTIRVEARCQCSGKFLPDSKRLLTRVAMPPVYTQRMTFWRRRASSRAPAVLTTGLLHLRLAMKRHDHVTQAFVPDSEAVSGACRAVDRASGWSGRCRGVRRPAGAFLTLLAK
jgi:hypothetical protein